MYCPWTGKPILNMGVYTPNRQLKIPGSSKDGTSKRVPLPPREFLRKCRIIDRQGVPDFTAEDLGIIASVQNRSRRLHTSADDMPLPLTFLPQQNMEPSKKRKRFPWTNP